MNYNLHDSPEAKGQRLLNALEPGTELLIHHHRETAKTYIVLRGSIRVLFYNDRKELTNMFDLDSKKKTYGIHILKGQWHTLEVLESGTVNFEVKDGLYDAPRNRKIS
jgi:cupin fold WbuC family metalloprotein